MSNNNLMINEIRVYKEHAKALQAIMPVIKAFDGKVLNKKLTTAMNETVLPDGLSYTFSYCIEYGVFRISCYNHNRSFEAGKDTYGYTSWGYVTNEYGIVRVDKIDDLMGTDTGKYRINAAAINAKIEECIAYYEKLASDLEASFENQDAIKEEFKNIVAEFVAFRHKYSYQTLEKLGILYELRYIGNSSTKDYSIKTW